MKTITKKIIAAIMSLSLLIPSTTIMAARGEGDVNVAAGKPAISGCYGNGGYSEDTVVANVTRDGVFISCASHEQTELVTIDLGARYPINEVLVSTYGNNSSTDEFGFGTDAVFEIWVTNTAPDQWTDISENGGTKLNVIGGTQFVSVDGGGYNSRYELATVGSYRYVQLKYIKGTDAKSDLYLDEIEVYTSQEAANNVPTVISVGKPVYSKFKGGYGYNFIALNDGKLDTAHWVYIGEGEYGNGISGVDADGNVIEDFHDHIINLEAKYPIEKVSVNWTKECGEIEGISVANDPDADEWIPLVYDSTDDAYYLSVFDTVSDYQFVKIEMTPGVWNNDRAVMGINEVSVYTTSAAAAAATKAEDRVNIAAGKKIIADNYDGNWGYTAAKINDGDQGTFWFTYLGTPQVTFDLGSAYTIENVKTSKYDNEPNSAGSTKGSAITKIEVSNDPNFNAAVELKGGKYRNTNDDDSFSNYTSYSQNVLPTELGKYRYVRITGYPDAQEAWKLNEVEIYTNKEEAALTNVLAGKVPAAGVEYLYDTTGANLTDSNNETVAYSAISLAVFDLGYPMDIDNVQIDLRNDGELNDADRHYEVYLSNTGTTEGALKVLDVSTEHQQIGYNTIVLPVDSICGYQYVLVGSQFNFWGLTEVRAMSTGERVEPEVPEVPEYEINNELTGDLSKDSVLTLSTSYTLAETVNKTVNLYIARYDDDRLTNVVMSEDVVFNGTTGEASLTYTITDEVTDKTEFIGFVWEKGTQEPFAPTAKKKTTLSIG